MSTKELSRYEVIQQYIDKKISCVEAAARLTLSVRQIIRLTHKVEAEGAGGLAHKLRGAEGNRAVSEKTLWHAALLLADRYADFKPSFAAEKLFELHGIRLGRERVRQLMIAEGLWRPKRRKENGEYRAWRERRALFGELEQFDGSYHLWFEERGSECCLLASIDDATGTITRAEFGEGGEGILPVFAFWKGYMEERGTPAAIYLDRFSTYKVNAKALVNDPASLTQFERAMKELDVEVIHAHSPQAKGRVERLFGTLQDRLVKELRLAEISTIAEANVFLRDVFLPAFNARFGVVARSEGDAHRELLEAERAALASIFSIRTPRTVTADFTVRHEGRFLQLLKEQPTLVCRKDRVVVEERMDGAMHLFLRGKELAFSVLPARPERVAGPRVTALSRAHTPPPDHPWRKKFILTPKANT